MVCIIIFFNYDVSWSKHRIYSNYRTIITAYQYDKLIYYKAYKGAPWKVTLGTYDTVTRVVEDMVMYVKGDV